jgi:hypothetical protein
MNWRRKLILLPVIQAHDFISLIIHAAICRPLYIFNNQPSNRVRELPYQLSEPVHVQFLNLLVTVNRQNPVIGRLSCTKVPRLTKIGAPRKVKQSVGVFFCQFLCPVRRTGVGNDDFKSVPRNAFQALLYVLLFILCYNAN